MNYNVKGTELAVSDEIRGYIEKRLENADKFLREDPTAHADIECEYAPVRDGGHYRAEFNLSAAGRLYRAEAWGTTLHEAIDIATASLQHELRDFKKKKLHMLRRSAVRVKEFMRGWRRKV